MAGRKDGECSRTARCRSWHPNLMLSGAVSASPRPQTGRTSSPPSGKEASLFLGSPQQRGRHRSPGSPAYITLPAAGPAGFPTLWGRTGSQRTHLPCDATEGNSLWVPLAGLLHKLRLLSGATEGETRTDMLAALSSQSFLKEHAQIKLSHPGRRGCKPR